MDLAAQGFVGGGGYEIAVGDGIGVQAGGDGAGYVGNVGH